MAVEYALKLGCEFSFYKLRTTKPKDSIQSVTIDRSQKKESECSIVFLNSVDTRISLRHWLFLHES